MHLPVIFAALVALTVPTNARDPLVYAAEPVNVYMPSKDASVVTLLEYINSRSDLSSLAAVLKEPAGFTQAFDTAPTWKFTFFAPSDTAFNNTGAYFSTFAATRKGKWWLGNLLQHHYVPNSALQTKTVNGTLSRFQTGTFLYVSAQREADNEVYLNGVAKVTDGDISITNGIVHVIDHILDPASQVFERELPKLTQSFIAGSCSNPALPYC